MTDPSPSSDFIRQIGAECLDLLSQLPGFVVITSGPEHFVEFANAGAIELAGSREIVGRPIGEALPEIEEQGFIGMRDEVYRSGKPHRERARQIRMRPEPDGPVGEGFIDFVYQPLKRSDGSVSGIIFAGYDVTEQKRAEDQMRSMQFEVMQLFRASVLGAMAMVLAHELNQPLAAISNYATAARRRLTGRKAVDVEETVRALNDIEAASHRAAEIIKLVREMIGKSRPIDQPVDLGVAIRQAVALGLLDAPRKGITHKVSLAPGLVVSGDPIQIQQVLLNLLRNAVDAVQGGDRRELEISARRIGDEAEIRIGDTGPGLPSDIRDRLFEPFFTTKEQGLGVGLSICRGVVERHGGRIWAEKRKGGGAEFVLRLPLAD